MALGSVASQAGVMTVAASPSGKQLPSSRRGGDRADPVRLNCTWPPALVTSAEAANTAAVRHDRRRGHRWP